jgi:osmotically-inducible protein OsmY
LDGRQEEDGALFYLGEVAGPDLKGYVSDAVLGLQGNERTYHTIPMSSYNIFVATLML